MDAILTKALSQGLGYGLFVVLLYYVMKKQDERDKKAEARETKYQEIISNFTQKFEVIESNLCGIKEDVKEVKEKIFK